MRNIILLIFLFPLLAFATLNEVDKTQIFSKNLLVNGGFENGKAKWTASAGTFTVTGTSPMIGLYHGVWDAAASADTLSTTAITIPVGWYGRNSVVTCLITTASGTATHSLQAYDGTNILASETVVSNTTATRTSANFIMPSSGTISLRLYANANEPSITVDDCYIAPSEGVNIGVVNPQDVFSANVSDTDVVSSENVDWISGDCTNATTGRATCNFVSGIFTVAPNCTGSSSEDLVNSSSVDIVSVSSTQVVVETRGTAGAYNGDFNLFCQKTGVDAPQMGFRSDTLANSWSGYHDDDCTWARTSTTVADPTADATCTFTQLTNVNFGTVTSALSGSDKLPGVVFTPKRAGRYYLCASFISFGNTAGQWAQNDLVDGSGNIIDTSGYTTASNGRYGMKLCGIFNATGVSSHTAKIQSGSDTGSVTIGSAAGLTNTRAVYWSIFSIDQSVPQSLVKNSVVSPSEGVLKIVSAYIENTGTPTVVRQTGSWISSITDGGTGLPTINISASTFSVAPDCVCSIAEASSHFCAIAGATTTSAIAIRTMSPTPALVDRSLYIICTGVP